jgi:uncharacterized protein (DUF433 family)
MVQSEISEDQLIAAHIIARPHGQSRAEARVLENGMHVWALIGHLRRMDWDTADAANSYGISLEAVDAALAYYHRNQALIDARLLLNDAEFED